MDRSEFVTGVRDVSPALVSSLPFGMLFGASAAQVGVDPVAATALSVLTYSAVAQFAVVELLDVDAALAIILGTVLLINLRYAIFSAALAPKVDHLPRRWRAVIAYPLMDINYAFAETRFDDDAAGHVGWYFLGVSLPIVGAFSLGTLVGAIAGQIVGPGFNLDFTLPLIFVALLAPKIEGRPEALAAVGAAVVAVAGAGLPVNLGLLAAVIAGAVVGLVARTVDRDEGGGGVP